MKYPTFNLVLLTKVYNLYNVTLVFCDLLKHTQSSPIRRCQPGIHGWYLAIRGLFIGIRGFLQISVDVI